jgi:hypothetical protein
MNTSFLMNGASFVKSNIKTFQAGCLELSQDSSIHVTVKTELQAAAAAAHGKCNTGLNESGWRKLAEVIGMCSPKSVKLMDHSSANKNAVMIKFLKTGTYPSSRTNGAGGSIAITDGTQAVDLTKQGVWSLSKKDEGKEFRALQGEVFDAIMASNKPVKKVRKPVAVKPATNKPKVAKGKAPKAA